MNARYWSPHLPLQLDQLNVNTSFPPLIYIQSSTSSLSPSNPPEPWGHKNLVRSSFWHSLHTWSWGLGFNVWGFVGIAVGMWKGIYTFCKKQLLLLKVGVYTARADFKMWIHRIMWATLFEIKGVLQFNHVMNHIGCKPWKINITNMKFEIGYNYIIWICICLKFQR